MLTYDPKDAVRTWDEGEYDAVLSHVEEKQSKAGNDMYELVFTCYDGDEERVIRDYVVIPKFVWKLKRLAQAFGVEKTFDDGKFNPEDFIGHGLRVALVVRKQEGYDEQNQITKYMPKDSSKGAVKNASAPVSMEPEEPLPF